ncbi:MAG: tetratricopeptide repeat protein [Bacteroidetes bacterium]|nr:tetratricopeptide repeat protein [Bacteroidota bacterium]
MDKKHFLALILLYLPCLSFCQEKELHFIHLAEDEYETGNYRNALVHLDSAARLSPADANIYLLEAKVYIARSEKRKAISSYDVAIRYNPNSDKAYLERAKLRYEVGDHRDYSLKDMISALAIKPDYAPYYIQYAYYLSKTDNALTGFPDTQQAIENTDKAILLDPGNAAYYNLRGQYKYGAGERLGAILDFSRAIELDSTNAGYYYDRGLVSLVIEDYESAVYDFTKGLLYDPLNEDYLQKRGHSKFNMGRYEEAVEDFSLTINTIYRKFTLLPGNIPPNHPLNKSLQRAYLFRGSALIQLENTYEACQDFKVARSLGDHLAANYVSRFCQ